MSKAGEKSARLHSQLMFPLGICHKVPVNLLRNLLLHKMEAVVLQMMLSRVLGPSAAPAPDAGGEGTTSEDEPSVYAVQARSKAAEVSKLQKSLQNSSVG